MLGQSGDRPVMLIVGMVVAVLAPLMLVLPALSASDPASREVPARQIQEPLRFLANDTASAILVQAVPAPPIVEREPIAPAVPVVQIAAPSDNPSGPEVLALQQQLSSLGYLVGEHDGVLGGATKHGITAFQKVEGLERTGRPDAATLTRLQTATRPEPAFSSPGDHFEVDIPRQVVFMVRGGRVEAISPTSTGNNKLFTSQGWTRRAVTPNGRYEIFFKRQGWRTAPLGRLYRPAYFNGGIALHGSNSIPISPASHGCVRLPMAFADYLLDNAPVGMVVYVYGGPHGENPQPELDVEPQGGGEEQAVPVDENSDPAPADGSLVAGLSELLSP